MPGRARASRPPVVRPEEVTTRTAWEPGGGLRTTLRVSEAQREKIGKMTFPVLCAYCGSVYDQANPGPVQWYADCTVFRAPCCGRTVDDRHYPQRNWTDVRPGQLVTPP